MPCICNETCKIVALTMLKTPLKIMGMKHLISNVVQSSIEKIFFRIFCILQAVIKHSQFSFFSRM